jgi:hypothetical protein
MRVKLSLAALFLAAVLPVSAQVAQASKQSGVPLVAGVGFSDYYSDWNGRLNGGTLWVDWSFYNFSRGPLFLHNFSLEIEGRDLNYGRTGIVPNLRQDTAEGGPIYTLRHYRNFHPYGKFLAGIGSIDFNHMAPGYSHDSRSVYASGGGVEYRAYQDLWVRGDWEYQFWTDFFHHHALNPYGFTVGAVYDFRHIHGH